MKIISCILSSVFLVCFSGCAISSKRVAESSEIIKEPDSQVMNCAIVEPEEGSLWSEAKAVSLYPDRRARKVGDIVNVRIVEDPEAELNANTSLSRKSSIDASKLKFLGYMQWLADRNRRLAQNPGTDDLVLADIKTKFDGNGSSDRNGYVKAYVPAVVEKVFPNGNLYINGRRKITVNNETQFISISGVIRAYDIDQFNEISSTYVASANITYSGSGSISDKQKPGWLTRGLDYVWPF